MAEIWRGIRGEMGGNLGKLGERLKCRSPSIYNGLRMFSGIYEGGSIQISRLPDSATLAPLRLVELASRQGRVGADVSSLRLAVGGAYLGECDFSIGFLFARRARTMGSLWLVWSIWLVLFIWLIWFIWFIQAVRFNQKYETS